MFFLSSVRTLLLYTNNIYYLNPEKERAQLQMQLKMGHWGSAPCSMNAHSYPLGNSRHPQDSWNSLGNTAFILDSGHPGSNCQCKPGRTRVWSAASAIPRAVPVPQGCFPRKWSRIRVNEALKPGNALWDREFVKKGGKSLLLGENAAVLGGTGIWNKLFIDWFDFNFLSIEAGTSFNRIRNEWTPAGLTQVIFWDCFLLWLILNVFRSWSSEIRR